MSRTTFSGPVKSDNGFEGADFSITDDAVGFFGATPVAQPDTTGTTTGFTAGTGSAVLAGSTFTGDTGTAAYTVGDIVKALKDLGLLAA
jgi:hypothetical protein